MTLEPLPADCMLDGKLHVSIRERLARVRELPLASVATLIGIENVDNQPMLVWERIEGQPLGEYLASPMTMDQRRRVAAELQSVIDSLHGFGIVHGAIHPRNIFVDHNGRVKITHISPLLYSDTAVDIQAIEAIHQILLPGPARVAESGLERSSGWRWRPSAIVAAIVLTAASIATATALVQYVQRQQSQLIDSGGPDSVSSRVSAPP